MKKFAVLGHPVAHSLSPTMHTANMASIGFEGTYEKFDIDPADLPAAIKRFQQEGYSGLNITVPHKIAVIPLLDHKDESVVRYGACNTIKFEADGTLSGYNTDVIGFSRSIGPLLQPHHTRALVLGTGGASLAVHYALKELGVASTAVSRTPKDGQLGYGDLTEEVMRSHTVIVNATPLGTTPDTGSCPAIPYGLLTPRHLCFDLVYNPDKTLFLSKAEAHGATIKNGLEMLYIQADEAWKIWNE